MNLIDEYHQQLDDRDDLEFNEYRWFEYKERDTLEILDKLKEKIAIQLPKVLEDIFTNEGAFYHPFFGDVWQTLQLYSAIELINRPLGILDVINEEWGGRQDFLDKFNKEESQKINSENIVFGYRYKDDNCHDYLFFNKIGYFDHLEFDQDNLIKAELQLRLISENPNTELSFDNLIKYQLKLIIDGEGLYID